MHCLTWNKGQSSRQELGLSLCEGFGGEVGDVFLFVHQVVCSLVQRPPVRVLVFKYFFSDSRWQLCYKVKVLDSMITRYIRGLFVGCMTFMCLPLHRKFGGGCRPIPVSCGS